MVLQEQKTCVNATVYNEVSTIVVKFSVKDKVSTIVVKSSVKVVVKSSVKGKVSTVIVKSSVKDIMWQRGMSHTNQFMNLGADWRSRPYIYADPCVMYGSYTTFPHPNYHTAVPAPGNIGNFNVPHLPGHQEGGFFYGMTPTNGIQQWHHFHNVGTEFAPLSNYFYPYMVSPSTYTAFPVAVNHGIQDGLLVSGTQGSVGNNANNLGSRTSTAHDITTTYEYDVSESDSVSREHEGSDSALNHSSSDVPNSGTTDDSVSHDHGWSDSTPVIENGVQGIGSRFASGQTTVFQNNNSQLLQGNYVGQAYHFPGNPWLNMPFNSSSIAAQSWAWSQAAPAPYSHGAAGGYVVGGGNMGMQSYQVFSNNWGLTCYVYPPIPVGAPQNHPHLLPNMQRMAGHTMSYFPQMTASPGRQLQLSSSNMGTLQSSAFTMYAPHQREFMPGTSTSHHNRPNGGATLGVPWYRGVGISIDRHRDMRLDVDHMSYEELLTLTERIGDVTTGLSEDIIGANLRTRVFLSVETPRAPETIASQDQITLCVICQIECKDQEKMGILDCGHEYHEECIKQWLVVKNTCCICKSLALSIKRKGKGVVNIRGD